MPDRFGTPRPADRRAIAVDELLWHDGPVEHAVCVAMHPMEFERPGDTPVVVEPGTRPSPCSAQRTAPIVRLVRRFEVIDLAEESTGLATSPPAARSDARVVR